MSVMRKAVSAFGACVASASGARCFATTAYSSTTKSHEEQESSKQYEDAALPSLLIFGGNGYVGSHVCRAAIRAGIPVTSVNRSGKPENHDSAWTDQVDWVAGDALDPASYAHLLRNALGVVSCVGVIGGSNDFMRRVNGDANVAVVTAAAAAGVNRFAYVSAHDYQFPGDLVVMRGYFEGKRDTEAALREKLPQGGVILRPGFIHGTRRWGSVNIPLHLIGSPLAAALSYVPTQQLAGVPLLGAAFVPPVSVEAVAKAAVAAATDPEVLAGVMDVWKIAEYE